MNIELFSIEDICIQTNIQSKLLDLQSNNKDKIKSALTTLATITQNTNRRDALYAMCGFYKLEIKDSDEIIFFFQAIKHSYSIDLYKLILQDISKNKNIYRQKIFIEEFLNLLMGVLMNSSNVELNEIMTIIDRSVWGEKLKLKFYNKIEGL